MRLAKQKKEEEEKIRAEEAEKKAKEAEEKRKRLEEAEKKRQAMVTAQKEKQEARGMVVEHKVGPTHSLLKSLLRVKNLLFHASYNRCKTHWMHHTQSPDATSKHGRPQGSDKDESTTGGGEESLPKLANKTNRSRRCIQFQYCAQ